MLIPESLEAIERISSDLFMVDIGGTEVIFSLPARKKAEQYGQLLRVAASDYGLQCVIYEHIFTNCVQDEFLANHNKDIPAGIPETIAKLILYLSGSDEKAIEYTNELLGIYRADNNAINTIKARICRVFSGYKFSDLDNVHFQELLGIYVQAEQLLMEAGIIENELKLIHPEEAAKPKTVNIEKLIAQDALEYGKFTKDQEMQNQRLQEQPEYQARLEQLRSKHNKNGG